MHLVHELLEAHGMRLDYRFVRASAGLDELLHVMAPKVGCISMGRCIDKLEVASKGAGGADVTKADAARTQVTSHK